MPSIRNLVIMALPVLAMSLPSEDRAHSDAVSPLRAHGSLGTREPSENRAHSDSVGSLRAHTSVDSRDASENRAHSDAISPLRAHGSLDTRDASENRAHSDVSSLRAHTSVDSRDASEDQAHSDVSPLRTPRLLWLDTRQASLTCPDNNGTIAVSNGKAFIVECGIDHAGGDLPNQPTYVSGIADCINACAQNSACVDFALSGSACYLKGSVGATVYDGTNGARLLGTGVCLS